MNVRVAVAALFAAMLAACAASNHTNASGPAKTPARIVSLMPSLTEDLCAIGAAKQLVGVSQFSYGIPCARKLPQVDDASSVDAEKIIALHPDLIAGIPAQQRAVTALRRAGLDVVLLADDSYADLFADIAQLGALSGHGAQSARLIASLKAQTRRLQSTEHFAHRPSVFVVLQTQPIWTVGPKSYIASLIALAGGRNAAGSLPQPYAQFSPEALLRLQPDVLLAARDAQVSQNLGREPWRSLRAVTAGHVLIVDNSDLLYRPGPRYNQALSWLIDHLRPAAR